MIDHVEYFEHLEHNPRNPNPWMALALDKSIPFSSKSKAAFLYDSQRKSRQFLYPFIRFFSRIIMGFLQIVKTILPNSRNEKALHWWLYWGMKYWVSPEANYLILRHFNLGSEVLRFIKDNVKGIADIPMHPLKPTQLTEVKDNLFLQHDLNLYNFVINLNKEMSKNGIKIQPVDEPDFSAISLEDFNFQEFRKGWTNFLDLSSAIAIFTPVYQFFLTDSDFWRATNSLQLDETIGIYAATILNTPEKLVALNNKHPMIPLPAFDAGFRLTLHGLSTEVLHGLLAERKLEQLKKQNNNL
jgi:hypothetical protein